MSESDSEMAEMAAAAEMAVEVTDATSGDLDAEESLQQSDPLEPWQPTGGDLVVVRWQMCVGRCAVALPCPQGECPAYQQQVAHHHHPAGVGADTFQSLGTFTGWQGFEELQAAARAAGWEMFAPENFESGPQPTLRMSETFVAPGAHAQALAAEGTGCVLSHAAQTGTETFVPEGKAAMFYTRHGQWLLYEEWMRASAIGEVETQRVAEGESVHNYLITAMTSEEKEVMEQAIGTVAGVPYLAGFNLPDAILLCSHPDVCQRYRESVHRNLHEQTCAGLFGYEQPPQESGEPRPVIPQAEILFYTCRAKANASPLETSPFFDYNPEQVLHRTLLLEKANSLQKRAESGDAIGARLQLRSYPPRTQADIRVVYQTTLQTFTPKYLEAEVLSSATSAQVAQALATYASWEEDEKRYLQETDPELLVWLKQQKRWAAYVAELRTMDSDAAGRSLVGLAEQSVHDSLTGLQALQEVDPVAASAALVSMYAINPQAALETVSMMVKDSQRIMQAGALLEGMDLPDSGAFLSTAAQQGYLNSVVGLLAIMDPAKAGPILPIMSRTHDIEAVVEVVGYMCAHHSTQAAALLEKTDPQTAGALLAVAQMRRHRRFIPGVLEIMDPVVTAEIYLTHPALKP